MTIKEIEKTQDYLIIHTDVGSRKIKLNFPHIKNIEKKCWDFKKRQCEVKYKTFGNWDTGEWFSDIWEVKDEKDFFEQRVNAKEALDLPLGKKFKKKKSQKIFGPPGTGKTSKLIDFVSEAINSGIKPKNIAFISFSNEAAQVARLRVCEAIPDLGDISFPYFCTLHALATLVGGTNGVDLCKEEHFKSFDKNIQCWTEWVRPGDPLSATARYRHEVLDEFSRSVARQVPMDYIKFSQDLASGLSKRYNNTCTALSEFFSVSLDEIRNDLPFYTEQYIDSFITYKRKNHLVSFDDVITKVASERFPSDLIPTFDLLIIDEAQDLSIHLWKFARKLVSAAGSSYIAGDDDQAIMAGVGAEPREFVDLDTSEKTIPIGQSYRVPKVIHSYVSQGVMPFIEKLPFRAKKEWNPQSKDGSLGLSKVQFVVSDDEGGLKVNNVLRKDRPQIHLEYLIKLVEADWQKFLNFKDPQEEWIFKSDCCGEELSKLLRGSFKLSNSEKNYFISPELIEKVVTEIQQENLSLENKYLLKRMGVFEKDSFRIFLKKQSKEPFSANWLIMSPTKATGEKISKALKEIKVPHFYRNKPILDAVEKKSMIRVQTIHTSKGAEAENTAIVVASYGDLFMLCEDPRLSYVALTRAKKRMFPRVIPQGLFDNVNTFSTVNKALSKYNMMFPNYLKSDPKHHHHGIKDSFEKEVS